LPTDDRIARIAALQAYVRTIAPEIAKIQRALAPLWGMVDALVAECARLEPIVAAGRRTDRLWATLLDAHATEADRGRAAEAIAATFPLKLSGGKRRWRAWRARASETRQSHHSLLQELLVFGLRDAARPERLSAPANLRIGHDERYTTPEGKIEFRMRYRSYPDTAPNALPPDELRIWLRRQAYKAAEEVIGTGDASELVQSAGKATGALVAGRAAQQSWATAISSDLWRIKSRLSPREQQVFAKLAEGESRATIAEQLGITPGNVRVLIHRIKKKARRP